VLAEIVLEFLARRFLDQLADDIGARAVKPALARANSRGPPNGYFSPPCGLKSRKVALVNG
jgi:hypothetical protein